jgi:pimeloyl-ACP methyl ester carboxylesterase
MAFVASPTPLVTHLGSHLRRSYKLFLCSTLLLVFCLAAFGIAVLQVRSFESDVVRTSFTLQDQVPLPVLKFSPLHHRLNVIAVLAHGYSADKEMMSGLGVDLARAGITAYTFDFPGHGASTVPYGGLNHTGVVKELVATVGEMVNYALAHADSPHPRLALIGYSLGTIAVGDYALSHPTESSLQATVLVAGILQDQPTTTNPRNLLVLSGQFDLPGINGTSQHLIASGCAVPVADVASTFRCGVGSAGAGPTGASGSLRERKVLGGLDHISIITAGSTHSSILQWLKATVDPQIDTTQIVADSRIHWLLFGALAALAASLFLLADMSIMLGMSPSSSSNPGLRQEVDFHQAHSDQVIPGFWPRVGVIGAVLLTALVVIHFWLPADFWAPEPAPFGFLKQQVSADVALFLLVAGAVLLGTVFLLMPRLRPKGIWPGWPSALRQVALAALMVLFLYFTLGKFSSFGWESLAISPARLFRAVIYSVMILPFFLGVRLLFAGYAHQQARSAVADLATTALILASFIAAIVMNFGRLSYLGILLPVVAILLLVYIGVAAWARRVIAPPSLLIFLSTSQALLLAWLLAATLPLIN